MTARVRAGVLALVTTTTLVLVGMPSALAAPGATPAPRPTADLAAPTPTSPPAGPPPEGSGPDGHTVGGEAPRRHQGGRGGAGPPRPRGRRGGAAGARRGGGCRVARGRRRQR